MFFLFTGPKLGERQFRWYVVILASPFAIGSAYELIRRYRLENQIKEKQDKEIMDEFK
ncbi:hypothetical protein HMI54_001390 [Coelomomyces lativittatus]|nr:hypothetical protein HMI55_001298 [Coelomomyces lativittatus]KAJ1510706.1 hypothetical protein HMI54_001390 [Coelomomyces lativittatus]